MKNLSSLRKVVATVAVAVLGATISLAGSSAAHAATGPQTGGTLYYITQAKQLNHLDPQRIYTGEDIAFANTYFNRSLLSFSPTTGNSGFNLLPDLATTTGTPSNHGKTWSWTLRSGVKWQDGTALTCADEKYGLSRAFATDVITDGPAYLLQDLNIPADAKGSPLYQGPYKKTGQVYFDKAVTCAGMTITVHLNKSIGDFNYFGTYPAMSPVKASADTGNGYDKAPWALGPYKISKYTIGSALTLIRNPQWKKATDPIRHAYPDSVVMRFGISSDVRDQIFLTNSTKNAVNYDQGLQPANNVAFFSKSSSASRGLNVVGPYTTYNVANVSPGHLECLDVRQAIFYALNNQAIITLNGGSKFYGTVGDNPIDPLLGVDYAKTTGNIHDSNFKLVGNPTYAQTLLTKAKTDCPNTLSRVTNASQGIVWDLANTPTAQKAATIYKDALNAAGLQVSFKFLEPGTYFSVVQDPTKEDDIAAAGWAADWPNASTVIPDLFTQNGGFDLTQNWTAADYPAFAAKISAAQGETVRSKQAAEWKVLAQNAMDHYWMFGLVFQTLQEQWGSSVGGTAFWLPQGCLLFNNLYVKG